jgi:hypothetical protein
LVAVFDNEAKAHQGQMSEGWNAKARLLGQSAREEREWRNT